MSTNRLSAACAISFLLLPAPTLLAQSVVTESYLEAAHQAMADDDFAGAEKLYALALTEAHDDGNLPQADAALDGLGLCFTQSGDFEKAAIAWRTRLKIEESQDHADPATRHELLSRLAAAYSRLGKHTEAHSLQARLVALLQERDDPRLADELMDLAAAKLALGDDDGADDVAQQAFALLTAQPGQDPGTMAQCLETLAKIKQAKGELDFAEQLAAKAAEFAQAQGQGAAPQLGRTLATLAGIQHANGKIEESEASYRHSLNLHEAVSGRAHPDWRAACEGYISLLEQLDRNDEADLLAGELDVLAQTARKKVSKGR